MTGQSLCGTGVTNTANATCTIITTPALSIVQNCPTGSVAPGGLLTYTGSITNTGNIPLTNVVVLNNVSGVTPLLTVATLAPGAGTNFTGSYLAPTNCTSASTATVTGMSICGVGITNATTSTCAITTTPGLQVTQTCQTNVVVPGGLLTYSGSVSNAGNITLTNVVVLNNQNGTNPVFIAVTLAPGQVTNYTGSYLAPTNCSSASISTATGRSVCGIAVTNTAGSTCAITTTPVLAITQNCPVTPTVPGQLLTYSGTVTNTGNITVTNVVILNNVSGVTPLLTVVTLVPGAGTNYTGSYLTPTNCSTTSTTTVTGQSLCGTGVTNTANATCTIITTPALKIVQNCPAIPAVPGGLLTFTGSITNVGNITLTNVTVLNNLSGGTPILTVVMLVPGASTNFSGSYLAPTNCTSTSTATVTGASICGMSATNSFSMTCSINTTPGLLVTETCPTNVVVPGGLLTYSGSVSNTGNITLTNVVVLNNQNGTNPVFIAVTLAPGQVTNYTGSYLAPTNCSSTSISTATGRSVCGIAVTNTAGSTCTITTTPAIAVTQNCPAIATLPGSLLTYSGSVSNAGNITLTNIIVTDNRPAANTVIFTVGSLAPGATTNFTGSYVVPQNCCVVWSTVDASGQACAGATVTAETTTACTVLTLPRIVVTKVCAPGLLIPGGLLTYSGSVSNAGNIALMNVTVTDSEAPLSPPIAGPIVLAPGQSVSYSASYTVPPDFCGNDTVTASGLDVCNYLPVTNSISITCPVTTAPAIVVTKNCPALPTQRGGIFTYTGSVSNAGNVTLVNVYVRDDAPTNNTPVIGPISLAPGANVVFTNSYVAPTCCCFILDTLTAVGQDHCTLSNVTSTATTICPLLTQPGIAVVQNCPASAPPMNSLYVFNGYVTNSGDVVLTNVFVYGPQGTNTPVLGPIELAPGQKQNYSGVFLVPSNTCSVLVSVAGMDICAGSTASNTASCLISTTPGIVITQTCPPGPVTNGSVVVFGGSVTNTGNATLQNVMVFGQEPAAGTPMLGPITLAPGASASFTGSYVVNGGSNPTTNTTVMTNGVGSVTTNIVNTITTNNLITVSTNSVSPAFGTIDPVAMTITNRFSVAPNLHGLMYAPQDVNWGPTLFYMISEPVSGPDTFDSMPASGGVTPRVTLGSTNYDAITQAAPDVGYGSINFYYARHDNSGVSTFGEIIAQGASSSADLWVMGKTGYNALAFAAPNLGYGANLFYFIRTDNTGLSTFGTINPTPGGVETDLYGVGTNFDSLVYIPGTVSTWGTSIFAYLRHNSTGSIIGTINPVTQVITDRMNLGTNRISDLTFTATDVGYGANMFYYLRPAQVILTTNTVTTYLTNTVTTLITNSSVTLTTNSIVSFTPTNTVSVTGVDTCQSRTVSAAADCFGPITLGFSVRVIGEPALAGGFFRMAFPTTTGESYTLQYKTNLTDPTWLNLQTLPGTGGTLVITNSTAIPPSRFFRIMTTP